MSRPCDVQAGGAIELFFYDELDGAERARLETHLATCAACRDALEELHLIRSALAARPDVSAPAADDWSGFMARLDDKLARERRAATAANLVVFGSPQQAAPHASPRSGRGYAGYLAMAALLALVTMSVLSVVRWRETAVPATPRADHGASMSATPEAASPRRSLAATSEQHLERSKLVLLGLTSKDADAATPEEWTYERELASNLLSDTRLYRMAAEDRGMTALAGVLKDLELVLLQTSLTESDPEALGQLQRLIRKRDLLAKMDVVTSLGI
jgi:hypothetical protein